MVSRQRLWGVLCVTALAVPASAANLNSSYDMKVLVLKYLHINQSNQVVDPGFAMDGWAYPTYASTVQVVNDQISAMRMAAENGSAYLDYKTSTAQPALRYSIIDTKEYTQVPPFKDEYLDYQKILTDLAICDYVDNKEVREVWIVKAPHTSYLHWESFMQGPIEIVGNPSVTMNVPLCRHSYRIYTHDYNRLELFPEVWGHQLEAEMERVSRSENGPDLFQFFNAPCYGKEDYTCAPRDQIAAGLTGEYFNNRDLTGTPIFTRVDDSVDFDWRNDSPDPGIPANQFAADGFSVRWIGWVVPEYSQTYTFKVTADDGVRLRIGTGEGWLIDQWVNQPPTEHSGSISLVANQPYPITLEYYEDGGEAVVRLRWEWGSPPEGYSTVPPNRLYPSTTSGYRTNFSGYNGRYFNNIDLAGTPTLTRMDPAINFSWGDGLSGTEGSPDPSIGTPCTADGEPADLFSASWGGTFIPKYTDFYDFYTSTDDGVRLWVDGKLLIDQWHDQGETVHSGRSKDDAGNDAQLMAGQLYPIVMEYYEHCGNATARLLQWRSSSTNRYQVGRCGNVHTGPNGRSNYDRSNTEPNLTDCPDWNPDGIGPLSLVSCANWVNGCGNDQNYIFDNAVLNYIQWHWQNMPGRNNTKTYQGQQLRNWWDVHGNFDVVMACPSNKTLLMPSAQCQRDLAISLVDSPDPVNAGGTGVTLSLTVTNATAVTIDDPGIMAGDKVTVSLPVGSAYANSVGACTASAPTVSGLLITCNPGVLHPNVPQTLPIRVILPAVGIVTATASATLPDAFQEPNTNNNNATATTTVSSVNGVDLFPTSMSATRVSGSATKVSVSETVKNQGNSRAGAFKIRYYLSTNATYEPASDIALAGKSNGSGICERALNSLNAGTSSSVSGKICYKPAGALNGVDYYVLVVDDAASAVSEYIEINNVMVTPGTMRW